MEEDLIAVIPCSSLAVDSVLRLSTVHSGDFVQPHMMLAKEAKSVGKFSYQCGFVAGVFSTTRCGLQRYRKQNDQINTSLAGAVAGAAVAARTRSWTNVIGVACLVSAISVAAEVSRTN